MNNWSHLLKQYREAAGATQAQMAEQFNTHPNTVSRWENGTYEIPNAVTWQLASFFFGSIPDIKLRDAINYLSELERKRGNKDASIYYGKQAAEGQGKQS